MVKDKKILIIKLISIFILFTAAIKYENALKGRTIIYVFLLILYITANIFRYFTIRRKPLIGSLILELAIIYFFEYYSRYQVNYIFHIFYFLLLLEIPFLLRHKDSIILSIISIIISNIKFATLSYLKPTYGNISQSLFFLFAGIFIGLLMNFLKYYKEGEEKKAKLNRELVEANIRLNEMSIIEERNRIARDLHDTIGHGLTGTIMGLEMVQVLLDDDLDKAKEMIFNLKDSSRENLVRVREVVNTLNPNENISKGIESFKELISSFKASTNVDIDFQIEGQIFKTNPNINIVLYRIIQEGLTNAIRHGKASIIVIRLKFDKKEIELFIKDNGVGVGDITKGFGLKSMEDRIFSLGGSISFMSKHGFSIVASIPVEG